MNRSSRFGEPGVPGIETWMAGFAPPNGTGMSCGGEPGGKMRTSGGGAYTIFVVAAEPVTIDLRTASPRTSIVIWLVVPLKSVTGAMVSWVSLTRANEPSPLGTRWVKDFA